MGATYLHLMRLMLIGLLAPTAFASPVSRSSSTSRWKHLALKTRGSFLVDASGSPFFWQADTAWELFHRLNQSEVIHYLDDRKAKGFNVIMSVALAEYNVTVPNRNGDLALIDMDLTKPNPAYFNYVDWCIDRATERGLRIALVPTWGRYVNGGWHGDPLLFTNESIAETWGTYIAQRYAGLPKILGADSDRWWAKNVTEFTTLQALNTNQTTDVSGLGNITYTDTGNIWNAMANAMFQVEGDLSFITYHPTSQWPSQHPPATGYSQYKDMEGSSEWLKMDAVQSSHECIPDVPGAGRWCGSKNYEPIELMWNNSLGVRPIMDLENHYEGGWFNIQEKLSDGGRIWNSSDVRTGAWTAVFGGAAGATYGAWSVWQFYNPDLGMDNVTVVTYPQCNSSVQAFLVSTDSEYTTCTNSTTPVPMTWQDELILPGSGQIQYLQNFITKSTPGKHYFDRIPDNKVLSTDLGEYEGRFSTTRDKYARWVAVYSPQGFSFGVDLSYLAGVLGEDSNSTLTWTQRWYSPRDGSYGKKSKGNGVNVATFESPTSGNVDNDWVLLLEDIETC